ncbi:MAG TPA: hypothetical protein VGL10_06135 [Gammaproteobacteria bacterium]
MKLYGYKDEDIEQTEPSKLAETTLVASPQELRMIAAFLEAAADNMEKMGADYSHEHLSDKNPSFESSPRFVVARD